MDDIKKFKLYFNRDFWRAFQEKQVFFNIPKNKTAKDLACASYMGDANLCLPPCTSNSATPASYASSMISTGISMAMSGGEMGGPVGAVAGLLAGLGIGAGLTKLGSMNSPPCAS